jgi:hypothetical protein
MLPELIHKNNVYRMSTRLDPDSPNEAQIL